ncbi:DNA-binding response regulator, OmpR family, contains REC and winged-helix (wHTH) domain [Oceanospirillum multiglobuliferum]|uniref:DNA-binding response regulator n=1 Tax=Oceanospirillum multiglobuliferum TaxID=64969 RepID=A0A1T4P2H9_9GAMM|nr:response regulator [Oceanospirillum multiglobuliferum]OPX55113.1 DNA-binding response regulator [Oceanospirillum multiglobuliferum]SJZ85713.1 DNA-binding response regulator, OmpR family, contains REC and winged-helix (wHTH) domain [Oceanospirillum multiglobuliferum]
MSIKTTNNAHILIVEDDLASRSLLASYLQKEGYKVSETAQADNLVQQVQAQQIDLVLLDINLPGKDGLTLTRELRAHSKVGIILVTSKVDEIDKIVGLELGADDYVTKPFNPRELLVRAKNLLWRVRDQNVHSQSAALITPDRILLHFEGWLLDGNKRLLQAPDQVQERLPEGEYRLLYALLRHAGQILSRDQLMDEIHGREWTPNDRSVDVLIGRIRRKLRDNPSNPRLILTAHGAGYLFAGKLD